MADIGELILGYRGAKVLFCAAKLEVFSLLDGRRKSLRDLARLMGTEPRATGIFLNALCALGFLQKSARGYRNTPVSRKCLVRGTPDYLGDNLKYQDDLWPAWAGLADVLQLGRTNRSLKARIESDLVFGEDYIRGMDNIARMPARRLAQLIGCPGRARLLDVGAGPGTYSAAFLRRHPNMTAVLLDLPETLSWTRRLLDRQPASLRRRVTLSPGDYHGADFGREEFDLVLLSHVTHDEGEAENKRLLAKAKRALRPGGRVIIHDFMLNSDGTFPLFGALFSMHMLVYTNRGRVYTETEYSRWLTELGFGKPQAFDIPSGSVNSTRALISVRK